MTSVQRIELAELKQRARDILASEYSTAYYNQAHKMYETHARQQWWTYRFHLPWEEARRLAQEFVLRVEELEREGQVFDPKLSLQDRGRQVAARLRAQTAAAVA